ncbi:MAG: multicopper oxidase domain-containing protein [Gaiellaceae bacterium MAG52_C11]|nr:multicopper oxidase domain-containing protein [Candidatus Gaiellasilicea maunaloa]
MLIPHWILYGWFALAALSTAYVAWDNFVRKNPEETVMKWGWVLITLYMGPVALALYVLADKEPAPGQHEEFIKPLWKQGVGSTVHCIAGDATGIIIAAAVTAALGLPMWIDFIVEYAAGFAFGLFIFQSLFMKDMLGGSYLGAVKATFVPEWLSMNMMAAGMFPTMALLMMGRDMRAMEPTEPLFWAVMSLGVIVGFTTAYPVNVWMVARNMKHGLMTARPVAEPGKHADADERDGSAHDREHATATAAAAEHGEQGGGHSQDGGSGGHGDTGHRMRWDVTRPQVAVVALLTVLALVFGIILPAQKVNLTLSADDVGGAIMPPGMIMTRDTPGEAMRDMSAIDPELVSYTAAADARGDQTLEPRLENGVKLFELETSVISWNILADEQVQAYAFNRQVPGPRISVTEGDRLRIQVRNDLPESTTVHWHGLVLPNAMDGPAEITQEPIQPGDSYTYEFTAGQAGTYFYHSHDHPDRQQAFGLYGALIVEPRDPARDRSYDYDEDVVIQLQEWLEREGYTYPAMLMEGGLPNFFTINGKAYPDTEPIRMRVGQRLRVRFIGSNNNFVHPMHVHGGPFEIVETDGNPVPENARLLKDTINVGPGERWDVIWTARRPGKWLLHCHIPHHTTNDNVEEEGAGGLTTIIDVRE